MPPRAQRVTAEGFASSRPRASEREAVAVGLPRRTLTSRRIRVTGSGRVSSGWPSAQDPLSATRVGARAHHGAVQTLSLARASGRFASSRRAHLTRTSPQIRGPPSPRYARADTAGGVLLPGRLRRAHSNALPRATHRACSASARRVPGHRRAFAQPAAWILEGRVGVGFVYVHMNWSAVLLARPTMDAPELILVGPRRSSGARIRRGPVMRTSDAPKMQTRPESQSRQWELCARSGRRRRAEGAHRVSARGPCGVAGQGSEGVH